MNNFNVNATVAPSKAANCKKSNHRHHATYLPPRHAAHHHLARRRNFFSAFFEVVFKRRSAIPTTTTTSSSNITQLIPAWVAIYYVRRFATIIVLFAHPFEQICFIHIMCPRLCTVMKYFSLHKNYFLLWKKNSPVMKCQKWLTNKCVELESWVIPVVFFGLVFPPFHQFNDFLEKFAVATLKLGAKKKENGA